MWRLLAHIAPSPSYNASSYPAETTTLLCSPRSSMVFCNVGSSVADPDPGSGAFLTPGPGSGIRNRFFPDLGSRIPTPYFLELSDKFLGKKFCNSLKTGPNFFLQHLQKKIIYNFVKFVVTKKGLTINFFFTPLFCCCFWIRDPGSGIRNG